MCLTYTLEYYSATNKEENPVIQSNMIKCRRHAKGNKVCTNTDECIHSHTVIHTTAYSYSYVKTTLIS